MTKDNDDRNMGRGSKDASSGNEGTGQELIAGSDDAGSRLDKIVRRVLPDLGLSHLHRMLRVGQIRLNGRRCKPADRVAVGDRITILRPRPPKAAPQPTPPAPGSAGQTESDPLIEGRILLENQHILALHKRRGTLVHGENSLAEAVQRYLHPRIPPSLSFRPGPLHRLDRNSSGIVLFGKSVHGARRFSELLQSRAVTKHYLALCSGEVASACLWTEPIRRDRQTHRSHTGSSGQTACEHETVPGGHGDVRRATGMTAETAVRPLLGGRARDGEPLTLVLCTIQSGRTHQIRAHAAAHGVPLAGDAKYGGGKLLGGYILHALSVELHRHDELLGFHRLVDYPEESVMIRLQRFLGPESQRAIDAVVQGPPKRLHSSP